MNKQTIKFTFVQAETFVLNKPNGHLFKKGEKAILHGLEDHPEYNGEEIEITNLRMNSGDERAYYFKGSALLDHLNYIFEKRLKKIK